MQLLGAFEASIQNRSLYFVGIEYEAREAQQNAKAAWKKTSTDQFWEEFTLKTGGRAVWLDADDQYLGRAAFTSLSGLKLICMCSSKGNVQIETKTGALNLSSLARVLSVDEPGQWFYDSRIEALLNGTFSLSEISPTSKSKEEVIRLVRELAEPKRFQKR